MGEPRLRERLELDRLSCVSSAKGWRTSAAQWRRAAERDEPSDAEFNLAHAFECETVASAYEQAAALYARLLEAQNTTSAEGESKEKAHGG